MRRIVTVLLSLLVVLATAGMARATDQSKFDKLIRKSVADNIDVAFDNFNPKAACVCQAGEFANWPGVLARVGDEGAVIFCKIVFFGSDGSLAGQAFCSVFAVLPK